MLNSGWLVFLLLLVVGHPGSLAAAQGSSLRPDVKGQFNLERHYSIKGPHYYHSSSRYDGFNGATGDLVYRFTVSGDFRRRVVGPREDGCVLEEFHWKNVKITYVSPQDGKAINVKPLPFAEGFTYQLCFEDDFGDISELVDHSKLPKTIDGLLFYEQIIDAHSPFDWMLTRKHGLIHRLSKAGTELELPERRESSAVDFRPFGYWEFHSRGPRTAKFIGLTLVEGVVGAILELPPTDVPVPFDSTMTAGEQTVTQKLITDWWGQVAISLDDHLPLWGRMYERATPLGKDQRPDPALACIHRKLSLARITAAEFGDEEPK